MKGDPGGFIKFSIIAVLVGLIAFYAVQTRARLIFPDYDKINKINEFYFAGHFRSPSACEEGLAYFRALPGRGTTGSLPVCPALLRVGTYGPEYCPLAHWLDGSLMWREDPLEVAFAK